MEPDALWIYNGEFQFCGHRKGWKVRKKGEKRERADLWDHSSKRSTAISYDSDD